MRLALLLVSLLPAAYAAEHVYIGQLSARSALIAWGTTNGANTIGRGSPPMGAAEVRVEGRSPISVSGANFVLVSGLEPDKTYRYSVWLAGGTRRIGNESAFRTWPETADRLTFFVIGDYGKGNEAQQRLGAAMSAAAKASADPVRFVLTTGDNIYRSNLFGGNSGAKDKDWENKFFGPYSGLLPAIPFYPSLGNHDGNETVGEKAEDLLAYLDNFFPPGEIPASADGGRYYRFQFANLAEFFALDTTVNSRPGTPKQPNFLKEGAQFTWFSGKLAASTARWKIPYFHHPMHSSGPNHRTPESGKDLRHFDEAFRQAKVPLALSGHEHNLQYTDPAKTGGVRYLLTGGGTEADGCPMGLLPQIEACIAALHFLRVDIDGASMRIRAITYDGSGAPVPLMRNGAPVEIQVTLPSQ